MTTLVQPELINASVLTGFRNKIINGDFDIWQRATSQTSSGYGSDDRWSNQSSTSTKTASRQSFTLGQTDVPGNPKYFSRTVVTSSAGASNYVAKIQKIEGVETLAGKTATLTFYAKADSAKNIATQFGQYFGFGGSPSTAIDTIEVTTHSLTTSWQKFSFTVNIPSISGKTLGTDASNRLELVFWFDAGSDFNARTNSLGQQSGTFDIARVSLVEGDATNEDDPFSPRSIGQELFLCQRYFEKSYDLSVPPGTVTTVGAIFDTFARATSSQNYAGRTFAATKRSTPTMTMYATSTGTSGQFRDISNATERNGSFVSSGLGNFTGAPSSSTGVSLGGVWAFQWTADAEI